MRNKNLILLTSITGLLLALTPSQALAQESTTSTTSASSQDSSDNKISDKCHWKKDIPVPENKYLKLLYDNTYKHYGKEDNERNKIPESLQKLVDNGEMTEEEAQYRNLILNDVNMKFQFTDNLEWYIQQPLIPDDVKDLVNETYDNPDNADEMVKQIIESYSLKENLEYIDKYIQPEIHAFTSDKELRDKYQKEFDELDKVIDQNKDDNSLWTAANVDFNFSPDDFKVNKLLDNFDTEEEQVQRFAQLHNWLIMFPLEEEVYNDDNYTAKGVGSVSGFKVGPLKNLYKVIKEKGLDNDDFYSEVKKDLIKSNEEKNEDYSAYLRFLLSDNYDIDGWNELRSSKTFTYIYYRVLIPLLSDPNIEIPRDITCDDEEETPGEDTDTSTNPETPDNPGDKETTTPTTKTTSKQDKPSTKTSTKSSDKSTINTTTNEDKKEEIISTPITTTNQSTTPNQVETPGRVNISNNPLTPNQEGFIPVKNTNPGTFNGGVSSNVDGEEISDGSKVDTGSPTTSLLNKIRTIF